jgi:hypothetical protein
MQWFAEQEKKGKGTWLDDKTTYEYIANHSHELAKEVIHEITILNESCDSEGCTG